MKTQLRRTLGLPASGNCEEQPEIEGRAGGGHMMHELCPCPPTIGILPLRGVGASKD